MEGGLNDDVFCIVDVNAAATGFGRCSLFNRLPLVSCLKLIAPNLFLASKPITLAIVVGTMDHSSLSRALMDVCRS